MLIYDDNRPENIRSIILWTVFILSVGYLGFNVFLPNNDMNIGIGVLQFVFATMVLCFYGWAAIKAIVTGSMAYADYLIVGIVLSWISTDAQAVLSVISRLSGFPPAFVNSELFAPFKLLSVVAAILHVIPKGAANGVVPRTNKVVISGFFVLATVLAVTVLAVRPDPRPLIENMPAKLRDFWNTGAALQPRPPPA